MNAMALIYHRMNQRIWPSGKIPYIIDTDLPDSYRVTGAIKHWERYTNISFIARSDESDYVRFKLEPDPNRHCRSAVGKRGGRQTVWLAAGCGQGQVIHEIGHVVGLKHEQQRRDRNDYVEIFEGNVTPGNEHNFKMRPRHGRWDIPPYYATSPDYDHLSIMHYSRSAFARGASDTIRTLNPYYQDKIGQRQELSHSDRALINTFYQIENLIAADEKQDPTEDPEWHESNYKK